MKRFLVSCRNHRGRTRDVAITAVSEGEAIGYLTKKGFTDCVVLKAVPGKAADDATRAVAVLPDPDAQTSAGPRIRSFGHGARTERAKTPAATARPSSNQISQARAEGAAGTSTNQDADATGDDSPWWMTTRGVLRQGWMSTQSVSGRAWSALQIACTKAKSKLTVVGRRLLKRDRQDG
jgi:hypothetical protein